MSYHTALRQAVLAKLKETPAAAAPVYSSPPAGMKFPVIVIGQVVLAETLDKNSADGFYDVAVECGIQGNSPAPLDALSDWVMKRLNHARLTSPGVTLSSPALIGENDGADPDAAGGPMMVRTQTFRIFAGAA